MSEQQIPSPRMQAGSPNQTSTPPINGPRLLHALLLQDLLSFGSDTPEIELGSLNVLVGPNGSGKSNFLEALDLLRSTPGDLQNIVSQGGGPEQWVWKGSERRLALLAAAVLDPMAGVLGESPVIVHHLRFWSLAQQWFLNSERIERVTTDPSGAARPPVYEMAGTRAVLSPNGSTPRPIPVEQMRYDSSILALRRDPDFYPELAGLVLAYAGIRLYRNWAFGRSTVFRQPQQADLRSDRLEEDFSNLGLVLNRMRRQPRTKAALIERLRDLYDGLTDVDVSVEGGTVQVFFTEGDYVVPATRLSDGSLRYLCLLAILLDPAPPPLIGLEEPELGLHPDLLPKIADLLVDASTRTQLIVTTHSDTIIDALSERPECVVVFDKHDGRTTFQRLDRTALAGWLEKYRLGQLWTRGQIGGTRW